MSERQRQAHCPRAPSSVNAVVFGIVSTTSDADAARVVNGNLFGMINDGARRPHSGMQSLPSWRR
jgi:hypothetical protein